MTPLRSIRSASLALTTVGALSVVAISATAGAASPASVAAPTRTLVLYGTPSGGGSLDLGHHGLSVGDQAFEHGKLSDAQARQLGTFTLSTQVVSVTGHGDQEQGAFTLALAGGSLELVGGHPSVERFTVAVVGGTGSYLGSRGAATFSGTSGGREKIVVTLLS